LLLLTAVLIPSRAIFWSALKRAVSILPTCTTSRPREFTLP
jgi:hypothetical protein